MKPSTNTGTATKTRPDTCRCSDGNFSPAAKRQAVYRARSKMPHSPTKYADVVHVLITTASPQKSATLAQRGIGIVRDFSTTNPPLKNDAVLESLRETCQLLKGNRKTHFVNQLSACLDRCHGLKKK